MLDASVVVAWMETLGEGLFATPLIVAKIDHLVSRGGVGAALAFYEDLASGAYLVEWWPGAVIETVRTARDCRDIGLAGTPP